MRPGQVLERALFHIDGAYAIPNVRVVGRVCRTNLPSNTAFRGFGGPQARIPPSLSHSLIHTRRAPGVFPRTVTAHLSCSFSRTLVLS